MKNVVTTIGAYEAMYAAFQGLVNPGDEVSGERVIGMKLVYTINICRLFAESLNRSHISMYLLNPRLFCWSPAMNRTRWWRD
jgi:aspartate/methionine/tyrosine aminotransferase